VTISPWIQRSSRCGLMWHERWLPKRQPECLVGIKGAASLGQWKYPDDPRHGIETVRVRREFVWMGSRCPKMDVKFSLGNAGHYIYIILFTVSTTATSSHQISAGDRGPLLVP
jgi:hypothetical protein